MTPGFTTMVMRAGYETPTTVYLSDGSAIVPDNSGQIVVSYAAAHSLFTAGWVEVPPAPAGLGGPLQSATQPGALLALDPETGDVFQMVTT